MMSREIAEFPIAARITIVRTALQRAKANSRSLPAAHRVEAAQQAERALESLSHIEKSIPMEAV